MFMSLIATCELCGANPFDYLTEPDRHASAAASTPAARMPWNYRETLASLASLPDAASQPSLTPCGPGKPAAQEFCTAAGRTPFSWVLAAATLRTRRRQRPPRGPASRAPAPR